MLLYLYSVFIIAGGTRNCTVVFLENKMEPKEPHKGELEQKECHKEGRRSREAELFREAVGILLAAESMCCKY